MVDNTLHDHTQCRLCFSPLTNTLYHHTSIPVAGVYTKKPVIGAKTCFPFTVSRCERCGLVQLKQSLHAPFYRHYAFAAGNAPVYKEYIALFARYLADAFGKSHAILEVGCGDGSLLVLLAQEGFNVLGVEPAHLPAQLARQKGVVVCEDFFSPQIISDHPITAHDIIIFRHVLEHIDDYPTVFSTLQQVSHNDTWLLIEVPDLFSTVIARLKSNFYHSHVCYFSYQTLLALLSRYGWYIHQVSTVPVFGGSILALASRNPIPSFLPPLLGTFPQEVSERDLCVFFSSWKEYKFRTQQVFEKLKAQGWRIAGYGAGERTAATFGILGLTEDDIICLYDGNASLHGHFLFGYAIPIKTPSSILEDFPDVIAIFATSHEEEIIKSQMPYRQKGGRFLSMQSDPPRLLE